MGDEDRQIKYINVGMEFTSKVTRKILDNLEGEEAADEAKEEEITPQQQLYNHYLKVKHKH